MNNDTSIVIDSCSDLPLEYVENNNLTALGLTFSFNGKELTDDFGKTLSYKEFYDGVRAGELPTTSQINIYRFVEVFRRLSEEGKSIIYIGFSSALSGCVSSALSAKKIIEEENANADITVIDTKGASLGLGLLVYYACEMLKEGRSKQDIVTWLEENSLHLAHWFVVDDLNHLKRGGRLTATTAVIGTLFQIKPVMHIDDNGTLQPVSNAKGKKQALKMLFSKFEENVMDPENQVIGISHGDCIQDVELLKKMITDKFKVKDIIINNVGPVIGSHAGPGVVALFFLSNKR